MLCRNSLPDRVGSCGRTASHPRSRFHRGRKYVVTPGHLTADVRNTDACTQVLPSLPRVCPRPSNLQLPAMVSTPPAPQKQCPNHTPNVPRLPRDASYFRRNIDQYPYCSPLRKVQTSLSGMAGQRSLSTNLRLSRPGHSRSTLMVMVYRPEPQVGSAVLPFESPNERKKWLNCYWN
jgi:hypothetical protein